MSRILFCTSFLDSLLINQDLLAALMISNILPSSPDKLERLSSPHIIGISKGMAKDFLFAHTNKRVKVSIVDFMKSQRYNTI